MSAAVTIAVNTFTGRIEHIDEANRKNKYRCRECEESVTVVQGKKNEWHFRHELESKCAGKYDKALHDYAVQLLLDNNRIAIADNQHVHYSNPQKEQWIDNKRSDVKVISDDIEIHFEIVVTNEMSEDKLSRYTTWQINCVRIDLTDPVLRTASQEQIRFAVLEDWINKYRLNWNIPKEFVSSSTTSRWEKIGVFLLLAAIAPFFWKQTKRKKRNRRFR